MSADVSDDDDDRGGGSSVEYLRSVVCPIMSWWMMGAQLGDDTRTIDVDDCEWCVVCVLLLVHVYA